MSDLAHQILEYGVDLEHFMTSESLPPEWFDNPDYLAISTANQNHLRSLLNRFEADEFAPVEKITCTTVNKRLFATAFLASELMVGECWSVQYVNLAGPLQLEDLGKAKEHIGVNHLGFWWPDTLTKISEHLGEINGIVSEFQPGSSHTALSVPFESRSGSRLVKFSSRILSSIVSDELRSGEATVIYEREGDEKNISDDAYRN